MEDPLLKKPAGSGQAGSAYDFGEIQNVPIQDTIPIPWSAPFSTEGEETNDTKLNHKHYWLKQTEKATDGLYACGYDACGYFIKGRSRHQHNQQ
jgi:hypothetical protein